MGKFFKFHKTDAQRRSKAVSPTFMLIEVIPEQDGSLTFNGEVQYPTWKNFDPLKLLISGETSATSAGTHKVTFTPQGNYANLGKFTLENEINSCNRPIYFILI